jgi:uncharacterized protein (DUF486 family)
MCQLLGMNCNVPTDICFSFTGFQARGGATDVHSDGWGIAFFEYCIMVPANRWGSQHYSLFQLKILQEVITLTVFVPFSIFYLKEDLKWDYLWAGLCILGAVFFVFREKLTGA